MQKLSRWLAAVSMFGWGAYASVSGTVAPFTDVATATGSILTATIDLLISDQDEPFGQNLLTHTWVLTNALPGEPSICKSVQLTNDGTGDGTSLNIKVTNSGTGGVPLATEVVFTLLTYGATDLLPEIDGSLDGHAGKSVRDLELDPDGITVVESLFADRGNSGSVGACIGLHADAPNSLQGKTWLGTFAFTLLQ